MSLDDNDELQYDDLSFYQQLTTKFGPGFKDATKNCSIIVVPRIDVGDYSLSREVFESHIFLPSPLYRKKHVSLNGWYEIEIDTNNTLRISYKDKGVGSRITKILGQEEIHSSSRPNSYLIIIVDQPLVDISKQKRAPLSRVPSFTTKFDLKTANYASAFIYLDSLRSVETPFSELRQKLFLFNEKYVILPNHINDALSKLREYREQFRTMSYQAMNKNTEDRDFELATELFITGNAYSKLWPMILVQFQSNTETLRRNVRLKRVNNNSNSPEKDAVINGVGLKELSKLNDLKTAFEKAKCIQAAFHATVSAKTLRFLDGKNSAVAFSTRSSDPMIMNADETLPAFIDLICEFILKHEQNASIALLANEYYIEKVRYVPLQQETSYAFTTFQAALEYLTH